MKIKPSVVVEDPTSDTPGDKNAASLALSTPKASHIYRPAPTGRRHYKSHATHLDLPQSTQHSALIRHLNFCPDPIKLSKKDTASQRKSPQVGDLRRALCKALEPACLEVIDQDSKDLALAIHGRGIQREHWAMTGIEVGLPPHSLSWCPLADERHIATRKLIERLPVADKNERGRRADERLRMGLRCVAYRFAYLILFTQDIQSRDYDSPPRWPRTRDESALALLVDHAAAVRAVTYAETTRTMLLDAEKC
ncbi:hypothetical protein K438DRAFT_1988577 [Mycena galopus ATCC 62051]|nr:hypothetical protein K438DRAFT_1988577 [Mycena galopus ATCC 62051]